MAEISTITARAVFTQFALSTTGIDPVWDKALHAYLRADALQHAVSQFGPLAQVEEKRQHAQIELEAKYGRNWTSHPDTEQRRGELDKECSAAETDWSERHCRPFWRAGRELAATPAPSMPAALFKAVLIEQDEVWNDGDFPLDAMQVLHEDFARLAGEV